MSVAKKSYASADRLATAQQEILQLTGVAFAISAVNLCVLVNSCIHCQLFFERVLNARTLRDALSIVNRAPQKRVSPRNRLHCYIEKIR